MSPACGGCGDSTAGRPRSRHVRALRRRRDAGRSWRPAAHQARAIVIGEDLGTVEPEVTQALGTTRCWMRGVVVRPRQSAPDQPLLPPAKWPEGSGEYLHTRPAHRRRVSAG